MKLACVTVTHNDFHIIKSYKEYYEIYASELDMHIIVDNNSSNDFKNILFNLFPNSIIIELVENGGVTKGFNEGIKFALKEDEISFVALICPDIKYIFNSLTLMKNTLINRKDIGIIGPIMYNSNNEIEGVGASLNKFLAPRFIIPKDIESLEEEINVDFISGGINMISRKVFEKIGYQDEELFMYGDEVDFDIRAKKVGFKLIILKKAICYHIHVFKNNDNVRSKLSYFLFSRNTFILYRKHLKYSIRILGYLRFFYYAVLTCFDLIKLKKIDRIFAYLNGIYLGLLGNNKIPTKYL